jgi:hypothetical protein
LDLANTTIDRNARVTLVQMAQTWLRLAKEQEQAAQQQQQIQPKEDRF